MHVPCTCRACVVHQARIFELQQHGTQQQQQQLSAQVYGETEWLRTPPPVARAVMAWLGLAWPGLALAAPKAPEGSCWALGPNGRGTSLAGGRGQEAPSPTCTRGTISAPCLPPAGMQLQSVQREKEAERHARAQEQGRAAQLQTQLDTNAILHTRSTIRERRARSPVHATAADALGGAWRTRIAQSEMDSQLAFSVDLMNFARHVGP